MVWKTTPGAILVKYQGIFILMNYINYINILGQTFYEAVIACL